MNQTRWRLCTYEDYDDDDGGFGCGGREGVVLAVTVSANPMATGSSCLAMLRGDCEVG